MKRFSVANFLKSSAFSLGALSVGAALWSASIAPANANENKETLEMLDLFGDVFEKIREDYVERPDDKELVEAAINGMLTHLDPHSSFLNAEAFKEMRVQTSGEFGGLGIEVTMRNGMVYVVSPIDDTPAFKAGLKAGDYISHIDDEVVMGMTIGEAVKKMRGKPGDAITLTILREGEEEPFDVEVVRDIIKIRSVRSDVYNDVMYLRVTSFSETTESGLKKAYEKHKEEMGDKLKGVVLDLRNNPGGLLTQAIAVSDMFLERGEIVSTRGRYPEDSSRYNADKGDILDGMPLVVLINGGSASASEIVAGALQDHRRAVILGTKSFGKGSVQTLIPLQKDSAMRITTSRYYTPSGESIQATGIEPDIIVEPAVLEYTKKRKGIREADLKGHLENGEGDAPNLPKVKDENGEEVQSEEEQRHALYVDDYQLARALDLVRALFITGGYADSIKLVKR